MSEISRRFYIEKIDGSCVRMEPLVNSATLSAGADTGIGAIIVETTEATPATGFWGSLAACHAFEVIVRRHN